MSSTLVDNCYLGSHTPSMASSGDLSPFLDHGCCYARSVSCLKIIFHITKQQHITAFECGLGVLAGASVL